MKRLFLDMLLVAAVVLLFAGPLLAQDAAADDGLTVTIDGTVYVVQATPRPATTPPTVAPPTVTATATASGCGASASASVGEGAAFSRVRAVLHLMRHPLGGRFARGCR